ncbi:MAG TPA: M20/M25/M40 family metallo-hydrolase [bacterium]|nr:M20/M25/M40 family metallo-hydrolase [bacterium]
MGAAVSDLPSFVNKARAVQRLQEMVRIPAVAGEERPMAEYVAAALRDVGCGTVHVDDRWNVLGIMGEGRGPSVMLLTHTDSAPPGAMQNPFSGAIMDGERFGKTGPVVYGRGACAPKSAVAAMLEALAALRDGGVRLAGSVQLAAVTKDLRANHEGIKELAASYPVKADFVIAGEPSDNHVVLGARGIGHFEARFTGKAAHWGRPSEAVNPLFGVADLLLALEKLALPKHAVLGGATVSPFETRAEAIPPRSPHTAAVMWDRRLLPEESVEAVRAGFQGIVDGVVRARPGLGGEVVYVKGMYPYAVPETAPTVSLLQRAADAALGRKLPTTYITFSSNAGYTIREMKIDGAAFGPGRIGDVTETEHVAIDSLYEAAVIYAAAGAIAAA